MSFFERFPNRKPTRLQSFDYASRGVSLATIVTAGRRCSLGDAHDETITLTSLGHLASACWLALPATFHLRALTSGS